MLLITTLERLGVKGDSYRGEYPRTLGSLGVFLLEQMMLLTSPHLLGESDFY